MCTVPEQSAIYALSVGLESFLDADHIRNRLATVRDKCLACKHIHRIKLAAQNEDVTKGRESDEEDKWEERRTEKSDDDEEDLEWIEGLNDGILTTLPGHLKRNKKKKKLMEGARRHIPDKFRAPTTKRGKVIPLKPQRFQIL